VCVCVRVLCVSTIFLHNPLFCYTHPLHTHIHTHAQRTELSERPQDPGSMQGHRCTGRAPGLRLSEREHAGGCCVCSGQCVMGYIWCVCLICVYLLTPAHKMQFCDELETHGISFIGPKQFAIESMGDKIASKKLAGEAQVCVSVCVCVRERERERERESVCVCVYIYVCMCVCMCVCVHNDTATQASGVFIHSHASPYTTMSPITIYIYVYVATYHHHCSLLLHLPTTCQHHRSTSSLVSWAKCTTTRK
jgi:hypothetical protein